MSEDSRAGLTTEIPMTFRRRAGKAVIVLPNGERAVERREALIDNTMIKLVARGQPRCQARCCTAPNYLDTL